MSREINAARHSIQNEISSYIEFSGDALAKTQLLIPELVQLVELCLETLRAGNKLLWCGNGGSAAEAQHMSAELTGRFNLNRGALASLCLNTDTSAMTAISNDFGQEFIFSRQVEALGKSKDLLICLSTSGTSRNILAAQETAKRIGVKTFLFTSENGPQNEFDYVIRAPSSKTEIVQQCHQVMLHAVCARLEVLMFDSSQNTIGI